jgi:hypothetical protein
MRQLALRVAMLVAMSALYGASIVHAQRGQSAKVDVTGKWVFAVETGAGSGTPTMTFKQEGEKLTGHYSGQLGEADLAGTVKGQDITFKFTVDVQGQALNATYTGTVDSKDSMKGKVELAGLGDGTFTAKRQ